MRKTPLIGQDIERWRKITKVQIPGTKNALYRAFLDSLISNIPIELSIFRIILKLPIVLVIVFCTEVTATDIHKEKLQFYRNCSTRLYELQSEINVSGHPHTILMQAQLEQISVLFTLDGVLIKNTVTAPRLTGLSNQEVNDITSQLRHNLYTHYNRQGLITNLYVHADTPAWNYNAIKSLIFPLQTLSIVEAHGIHQESDDQGIVVVEYSTTSQGIIKKKRKQYEILWNDRVLLNISNSDIEIRVNPAGTIEQLDLKESITAGMAESPVLKTHYYQRFSLKDTQFSTCKNIPLEQWLSEENLVKLPFTYVKNKQKQRQEKKEQLKGVKLENLLSNLKSEELKNWAKPFGKLVNLLSYYPENLLKIPDLIESNKDRRQFINLLVTAVFYADCTEAQPTLLKIMKQFQDNTFILERAVKGHHFTPQPAESNARYLMTLYKNTDSSKIKKITILALGSLARKLDSNKPLDQVHPITEFILQELQGAKNPEKKYLFINALGNTRDSKALDVLQKMMDKENARVATWAKEAAQQITGGTFRKK